MHIDIDNKTLFDIPPAICDRMLVNNIIYPYISHDGNVDNFDIGIANTINNKIYLHGRYNKGYLMFYFPIDSNK